MLVIGGSHIAQHGGGELVLSEIVLSDKELGIEIGYDQFKQFMCIRMEGKSRAMSPIYDLRGKKCAFCDRAWGDNAKEFVNQVALEDGLFAHRTCFVGHLSYNDQMLFDSALSKASFRWKETVRIPNEYGGAWNESWFTAEVADWAIMVKFGRRKRVWSIEFTASEDIAWSSELDQLFSREEVTKKFASRHVLLHAYTEEKVHEYFRKIYRCLNGRNDGKRGAHGT